MFTRDKIGRIADESGFRPEYVEKVLWLMELLEGLTRHPFLEGKLAALFARSAPRDAFDAVNLLEDPRIDRQKLRLGFVLYGAMSRRDWREVGTRDIVFPEEQYRNEVSVLLGDNKVAYVSAADLASQCRLLVEASLLPLNEKEVEFLRLINEEGVILPSLLTSDEGLCSLIPSHPALQWKTQNVRKHRGLPEFGQ